MAIQRTPGNCAGRLTGTCPVTGGAPGSGPGPFRGFGSPTGRLGAGRGAGRGLVRDEIIKTVTENLVNKRMGVK